MVTELLRVRPVNYNPGIRQKLIKLEISSCRCSQHECTEESVETEGYAALYTPLMPLNDELGHKQCNPWSSCSYNEHGHALFAKYGSR